MREDTIDLDLVRADLAEFRSLAIRLPSPTSDTGKHASMRLQTAVEYLSLACTELADLRPQLAHIPHAQEQITELEELTDRHRLGFEEYELTRNRAERAEARVKELLESYTSTYKAFCEMEARVAVLREALTKIKGWAANPDGMVAAAALATLDPAATALLWERDHLRKLIEVLGALMEVPRRKMALLCRDYPDDKESAAWLAKMEAYEKEAPRDTATS